MRRIFIEEANRNKLLGEFPQLDRDVACKVDNVGYAAKPAGSDIGAVQNRMKTAPELRLTVYDLLAAVTHGCSWTATVTDGQCKEKFVRADMIAMDFDNGHSGKMAQLPLEAQAAQIREAIKGGMTITPREVAERCRKEGIAEPLFMYSSFSCGAYIETAIKMEQAGLLSEQESDRVRDTGTFRAVWLLDREITNVSGYQAVYDGLAALFPEHDVDFRPFGLIYGSKYTGVWVGETAEPLITAELTARAPKAEEMPLLTGDKPPVNIERDYSPDEKKEFIAAALKYIRPSELSDEEWVKIGMAMKTEGFDYIDFDEWCLSDGDVRYDAKENRRRWESFPVGKVTGGTIVYLAKQNGFDPKESFGAKHSIGTKKKSVNDVLVKPCEGSAEPAAEDLKGQILTISVFDRIIGELGYDFRFNIIRHTIEYVNFGEGEFGETLNNTAPTILTEKFAERGIKKNDIDNICRCLFVHSTRNAYNPVLDIIGQAEWDGTDRVEEIYCMWNITDSFDRFLIRKWLYQCYCLLFNNISDPFGAILVLTFSGSQGACKTAFFKRLAIRDEFFKEGATLNPDNKDDQIQAFGVWICELGEVGCTMRYDNNMLKNVLTRAVDEIRPPFAREANRYPRRTSMCATVNDESFLIDTTGNRRWAVIRIGNDTAVDYNTILKFDPVQLWAQVAAEVEDMIKATENLPEGAPEKVTYKNAFRLTHEQEIELIHRNEMYVKPVKAQDEVADIISLIKAGGKNVTVSERKMTVTEFIEEAKLVSGSLMKYNAGQVGRALRLLGYRPERIRVNGTPSTVYDLPYWERSAYGQV